MDFPRDHDCENRWIVCTSKFYSHYHHHSYLRQVTLDCSRELGCLESANIIHQSISNINISLPDNVDHPAIYRVVERQLPIGVSHRHQLAAELIVIEVTTKFRDSFHSVTWGVYPD